MSFLTHSHQLKVLHLSLATPEAAPDDHMIVGSDNGESLSQNTANVLIYHYFLESVADGEQDEDNIDDSIWEDDEEGKT